MCSRPCVWDYYFSSIASEWWDEGTYHRKRGTEYPYSGNHDRRWADHWRYSGGCRTVRLWSGPQRSCQDRPGASDRGWTYPSGQDRGNGGESAEGSREHDARRRRGSRPGGRDPRNPSGAGETPWKDEVQDQLWAECTEAFHRGRPAFRSAGFWDRRGCETGKACRFITRHWKICRSRDGGLPCTAGIRAL